MTKPTGSETSAMDPAVDPQDSQEPSEFPPPSPMAYLKISTEPYEQASRFPRIYFQDLN
jgi:hypothetical protein